MTLRAYPFILLVRVKLMELYGPPGAWKHVMPPGVVLCLSPAAWSKLSDDPELYLGPPDSPCAPTELLERRVGVPVEIRDDLPAGGWQLAIGELALWVGDSCG